MTMKRFLLLLLCFPSLLFSQAGRIYTKPDGKGELTGRVETELSHAVAVEHDRERIYVGALEENGLVFRFPNLPIGKYGLILLTRTGIVYEGLDLGDDFDEPEASRKIIEQRINESEHFFNHRLLHRLGLSEDKDTSWALVQRWRVGVTLEHSDAEVEYMVRRFEIITFTRAADDWQLTDSRHVWRDTEPQENTAARPVIQLSTLNNLRVVDNVKDLGLISLPNP